MPIVLAVIGAIIAAGIWYHRVQSAKAATTDLLGAANDVRLAARRFGYKRKTNVHPVDMINDPRLAAAGIAAAIAGMDAPLSREEIAQLELETQVILRSEPDEAKAIAAFGRWISGQAGSPDEAVRRLSKRLRKLAGEEVANDVLSLAQAVATADGALDERQEDALRMVRTVFRVK
ncbi:MAG: TerB family tellurite resistance protein [Pseudomonadota bacterium]